MLHLVSILWNMLCEVFFDHKDEHNFRSERFKAVRMFGMIICVASIVLNFFLANQYIKMSMVWRDCEVHLDEVIAQKDHSDTLPVTEELKAKPSSSIKKAIEKVAVLPSEDVSKKASE